MKPNQHALQHQLDVLSQAVSACEDSRRGLIEVQARLAEFQQRHDERMQAIEQEQNALLSRDLDRIAAQVQAERETLQRDLKTQSESHRHQRELSLKLHKSATAEEVGRLTDQENSELWVLNSILDEDAADSPTEQLERERDHHQSQKLALEQRAEILQQQIDRSRQLLADCHAGVDTEDAPPRPDLASTGGDLVDAIRESGDRLLAEAASLESQTLPQWIRGSRLWVLALAVGVLVLFPVLLAKPGLINGFLNPDLAAPDWQWLAVAVTCGFAAAMLLVLICTARVQGRLRNGFSQMLTEFSTAKHATKIWQERSARRLEKMERAAQKWAASLTRKREEKTAEIRQRFEHQRTELEMKLRQAQQRFDVECENDASRCQERWDAELARIEKSFVGERERLRTTTAGTIQASQSALQADYEKTVAAEEQIAEADLKIWNQQLSAVKVLTQESASFGSSGSSWRLNPNGEWDAPESMPESITPGDLLVTFPKPPEMPAQTSVTNLCVELPAILCFPRDTSIVVEHDAAGRDVALAFLRTQILRLLTLIPPGRIRLTLIDPVGLGQSFSAMMHLADFDELLIHSRIWTDELQIREQLRKITEHMENVFQTYLRSEFSTIEEYNKSAGEVAEPYHFVVIAGFPQAFSGESARHLSSILTSGSSCGVHALVAWNPSIPGPPGFDNEELRANCVRFHVRQGAVLPARETPAALEFEAYPEPAAADYVNIVKAVGVKSKDARRVEVSFRRIAPRSDALWQQSTAEGIDLPIGRAGARLQFLRLGRGTSQHVLVAGKTGSGKSTFLHIVITNLALHFSPSEIQFYLIDFKKGVEFRTYAAHRLPHARVVAIESDREFGLSVLERLDAVLQERGELFRSRGVQDVPSFRKQFPGESMPRLLLLIDEFQEFFVAEDRVASRASLLLDRLVRQGRAFGVHVMLGSQTLGGAYSLARSTMGQVAVRIALQCSESDAHLILSEDNSAARLLTRPGEAIYNDANGLKEGNHPFQIAWLEEQLREECIQQLHGLRDRSGTDSSMIVFEGNVAPTVEHCGPLRAALRSPADKTRRHYDSCTFWLGEPVAIAAPTQVELRRAGGQNLLLAGQDEMLIDSMLGLIILSVCAAADSKASVTMLHSGRNEESIDRFNSLTNSRAVAGFNMRRGDQCVGTVQELAAELKRREERADHVESAEILLIVRDIGLFRELRREEDDFSLGSFGEPKAETTASVFGDLIRRGPLVGIHVIVWADTFSNAMRWLSTSLLREFENRIALRMNQTDSASLVDSPVAAGLASGRALLYRDQTGAVEKFRPFSWPSNQWLQRVASWRSDKTDDGLDIESLRIE